MTVQVCTTSMSRATAITLLYEMVDDMTIANGFNYDWQYEKSGDLYFDADVNPILTITLGDEEDESDIGGAGSSEYICDVDVEIQAKGVIEGIKDSYEIPYEQQIVMSKMRDDIVTRFDSPFYLRKNGLRAITLSLIGVNIEPEEEEERYTTDRVVANYTLKYKTQRKLLDM